MGDSDRAALMEWIHNAGSNASLEPIVMSLIKTIPKDKNIGFVGTCFGARFCFHIGSIDGEIVKAIASVHPSLLQPSFGETLKCPCFIIPTKEDPKMQ
jgi:dienelactone hydrolase